jgi:hypothetical protein
MEPDNKKNEIKPNATTAPVPDSRHDYKIKPHVAMVETYTEDMANVIGGDSGSLVKKIIHSEEEHEIEKKNLSPQSKKNRIFIFVGISLLILALATIVFLLFQKGTNNVVVQKLFTPLVFNDQIMPLDISGLKPDEIAQAVLKEIGDTKVSGGQVEGIYLSETQNKIAQNIGLRRFLILTNSHFSPTDNTAFVSDNFLLGVVKNQVNADPTSGTGFFMLMKMRSTTDIFDSLRAWEPNILNDMHGFLGINIDSTNNYLLTKSFTDGIVENKNARILYDQNGNMVLMYVFADNNSVIITDSESAANEIILRLASNQTPQQ